MAVAPPRIALTIGELAGIGPDICIQLAQTAHSADITVIGDADALMQRAHLLHLPLQLVPYDKTPLTSQPASQLRIVPMKAPAPLSPGMPDPGNSRYLLDTLDRAIDGCLQHEFDAMVTAPVNKGVINDSGIAFTGHTEYIAARCKSQTPVMLLVAGGFRVALATTHLPLAEVPRTLTREKLTRIIRVLHADLEKRFGISRPHILVLGLNPHAGEGGHMGREELEVITPALELLRAEKLRLTGPVSADTAFAQERLEDVDAVLAMYHDQGLPILKYAGFGQAVNITLGLPIIRTSVDHGTALELAGSGHARHTSLEAALNMAVELSLRK